MLSADNGPADLGSVNCWSIGSPGPYIGAWQQSPTGGGGGSTCKTTTWEGGHRVVGVMRWLGHIQNPGRTTPALAMTVDYLPTFLGIAGIALPDNRVFDGVDLSSVLLEGSDTGHTTLFHPKASSQANQTQSIPAMRYLNCKDRMMRSLPRTLCPFPDAGVALVHTSLLFFGFCFGRVHILVSHKSRREN